MSDAKTAQSLRIGMLRVLLQCLKPFGRSMGHIDIFYGIFYSQDGIYAFVLVAKWVHFGLELRHKFCSMYMAL